MLKAKDIMTTEVITVAPETEIAQAARLLLENTNQWRAGCRYSRQTGGHPLPERSYRPAKKHSAPLAVYPLGRLYPADALQTAGQRSSKIAATTVAEAMTPNPTTVDPETDIEKIAALMVEKNFHTLPVVEAGKVVGVLGKEDVLRTLIGS